MWMNEHASMQPWRPGSVKARGNHRYLPSSRYHEVTTTFVVVIATLAFLAVLTVVGMTLIAAGAAG